MAKRNFHDQSYVKWRKAVYQRDGHKCKWPGCNNRTRLNAHHIVRWSDSVHLRYAVGNGITLCYMHHSSIKGKEKYYVSFFRTLISK